MTHRRKTYIIYPPGYNPDKCDKYHARKSNLQALKLARRLGLGSEIHEQTHIHPRRAAMWESSIVTEVREIV